MQLIEMLLIAVSVLAILAGGSVMVGCAKNRKAHGIWFFLSTLGAAVWSVSIAWFLLLGIDKTDVAGNLVIGIIAGITLCDIALLGYCSWSYRGGKATTAVFGVLGAALVALLIAKPELFYTDISLNFECNKLSVVKGWYYFALIGFFTLISVTFSGFLSKSIKKENNKNKKTGLIVFYVGLTIGGILALVFDLILLSSVPTLIWIGPMATIVSILTFYYSIVRFRSLSLTSTSMRTLSYSILVMSGVLIYILVFYMVFAALFHQQNPSVAVVMLNLIMLLIIVALYPALKEISGILLGMVNTNKIQFDYMRKKLSKINGTNVNLRELAGFLADNMHYEYVALIMDGRVYSSNNPKFAAEEILAVQKLKNDNSNIWLPIDRSVIKIASSYDISRIAELVDKDGKVMGRVVFGKKLAKTEIDREDLIQYEAIINYTAMVIENGSRKS